MFEGRIRSILSHFILVPNGLKSVKQLSLGGVEKIALKLYPASILNPIFMVLHYVVVIPELQVKLAKRSLSPVF